MIANIKSLFFIILISNSSFTAYAQVEPPTVNIPPTNAYACATFNNGTTTCAKNWYDTLNLGSLTANVNNNNVVDTYDQNINDYSLPVNASSSSFKSLLSIKLDTSTDTSIGTAGATSTANITIGNNINRLITTSLTYQAAGGSVTSVKIGSTPFTKLKTQALGSNVNIDVWYLINPPTGTQTITVTWGASGYTVVSIGLASFYNVDQINGINTSSVTSVNSGNTASIAINITPTITNSWIVQYDITSFVYTSATYSDTKIWGDATAGVATSSQYKSTPMIGSSNTLTTTTTSNGAVTGSIAYEIESPINNRISFPPSNSFDNKISTEWRSLNEVNPRITLDSGSSNLISALAIFLDKTQTNETQITISTSSNNSTFNLKRTINISTLVNGTYNYIRWDMDNTTERYVKILGSSGNKVTLAIVEAHLLEPALTNLFLRHGHEFINGSNSALPLNQ